MHECNFFLFLLLFKYSCLHFPPTTTPHRTECNSKKTFCFEVIIESQEVAKIVQRGPLYLLPKMIRTEINIARCQNKEFNNYICVCIYVIF